jgi:hypothetical protein
MRAFCTGSNPSAPAILLEAGQGASAYDLLPLQISLDNDYTICSYDRAGYGKS